MKIVWSKYGYQDYVYWYKNNKKILKKINTLILDIQNNPFKGLGSPEPLKYELNGFWSRRINKEHRLIYTIKNDQLIIIQCRYHY